MKSLKLVLLLTGFIIVHLPLKGQVKAAEPPLWAVKTNLLYWATTTPNISFEYALNTKVTLDITGSYNPFRLGSKERNRKIKHWLVEPELRLWTCEKYIGQFWGAHLRYGRFNAGGIDLPLGVYDEFKDHRFEGSFVGGGVSYGYQWYLSPRWNLEAVFSFGYMYVDYKKYECRLCGEYIGKGHKHYLGPTKIGITMVYLF